MKVSVKIEDVSKSFDEIRAVDNVSVSIEKGEIFGFIGPDGAGKTTLFRMITTLLFPDKGSIEINGADTVRDYKYIRNITGYMPGKFSLYQDLSVEENLTFFASIFGTTIKENYDNIKMIYSQLEPFKSRPAGKLSGGMKQKLALSCALVHKPEVLVLDEPTTGVDAISRKEFWQILGELKNSGITIVVSTPYMDEANRCDRVALLKNGHVLKIDTPSGITGKFGRKVFSVKTENIYNTLRFLRKEKFTRSAFLFGQDIHFIPEDESVTLESIAERLESGGFEKREVKNVEPQIEDCFIDLMPGGDEWDEE